MAYVETICETDTGYSCSIVGERGGFVNAGTAVHELAHSLGARHDGSGSNSVCPGSSNYIMAPFNTGSTEVLGNAFRFSQCSLDGFRVTLSNEQAKCLADSDRPGTLTGQLPGQAYSPDVQCQDVFGARSAQCQSPGLQEPEDICVRLWCTKPTNPDVCITTSALSALYGTPCGHNKICKQGFCIHDAAIANKAKTNRPPPSHNDVIKPSTPARDRCDRDQDTNYCYRLILTGPQYCDNPDVRTFCCLSCHFNDRYA